MVGRARWRARDVLFQALHHLFLGDKKVTRGLVEMQVFKQTDAKIVPSVVCGGGECVPVSCTCQLFVCWRRGGGGGSPSSGRNMSRGRGGMSGEVDLSVLRGSEEEKGGSGEGETVGGGGRRREGVRPRGSRRVL